jgi:hydrogenase-4 component F
VSERRWRQFYVLTPLFAAGMLLVVLANNLGVMWIAVEATALSSVLLVALYNRKTSLEAAWKYVMLGGLGLVLALFGTILTYAAAIIPSHLETASFNWSSLLAMAPRMDQYLMTLAFHFRACGLRHQGRPGPDAHLAARRPQRSALAHQRHALRRVA